MQAVSRAWAKVGGLVQEYMELFPGCPAAAMCPQMLVFLDGGEHFCHYFSVGAVECKLELEKRRSRLLASCMYKVRRTNISIGPNDAWPQIEAASFPATADGLLEAIAWCKGLRTSVKCGFCVPCEARAEKRRRVHQDKCLRCVFSRAVE